MGGPPLAHDSTADADGGQVLGRVVRPVPVPMMQEQPLPPVADVTPARICRHAPARAGSGADVHSSLFGRMPLQGPAVCLDAGSGRAELPLPAAFEAAELPVRE